MTHRNPGQMKIRTRRTLVAAAVSVALVGAVAISEPWSPANAAAVADAAITTMHGGFADLVSTVRPAVVNVQTTRSIRPASGMHMLQRPGSEIPEHFRRFSMPMPGHRMPHMRQAEGVGSGFIIDASGFIVTSHHVVKGADTVTITLEDGRKLEAQVAGVDPKTDLALLKIDAGEALPVVEFGDSDVTRVGDWVIAVGSPFGLGGTVTAGIVSARGRDIGSGPYDDYIQIDAPINRGNSGGPLFDRSGRVIGVNTMIISPTGGSVGIGFAIPADVAGSVIESLRTEGRVERGWLGVQIQGVDETLAEALGLDGAKGALVASVMAHSPGARAGLRPGDVIVSFAGESIETVKDLPRVVAELDSGVEAEVEIWRGDRRETLTATIGAQAHDSAPAVASVHDDDTPRLGVALASRDEPGKEGVLIAAIIPGSPAARNGFRPGDVIVNVGNEPVNHPDEAASAIRAAAAEGKPVLLLVERGDHRRYIAVDLGHG